MYPTKTIKKPNAKITTKQKDFLEVLIKQKYENKSAIQRWLLAKLDQMRAGEASDAIKILLGRPNRV